MLPIRDLNPSRTTPFINWLMIGICVLTFFLFQTDEEQLFRAASIPCEISTGEALSSGEIGGGACLTDGQAVYPEKNIGFSILASIFFHGSVIHLLSNMWVLLIFGNNVEDAFGHISYLIFYLVAGLVASGAHIFLHPESTIPVVGASGAIAGVMGTYAVLYPRARVTAIIPPLFFWPFALPALLFLVIWFGSQFFLAGGDSMVAWEAHVAGFLFGVIVGLVGRGRLKQHATTTENLYPVGRLVR